MLVLLYSNDESCLTNYVCMLLTLTLLNAGVSFYYTISPVSAHVKVGIKDEA